VLQGVVFDDSEQVAGVDAFGGGVSVIHPSAVK
jgi:hypothetical protein